MSVNRKCGKCVIMGTKICLVFLFSLYSVFPYPVILRADAEEPADQTSSQDASSSDVTDNNQSNPTDTTNDTSETGDSTTEEITQASEDRKSTRLNSSHSQISYAVFC